MECGIDVAMQRAAGQEVAAAACLPWVVYMVSPISLPSVMPRALLHPAHPQAAHAVPVVPAEGGGGPKKVIAVRDADVGSLIGRAGSVIKGLIADSGCHIQISPKDMRPGQLDRDVTLSGSADQIAAAEGMIRQLISTAPGPAPHRLPPNRQVLSLPCPCLCPTFSCL